VGGGGAVGDGGAVGVGIVHLMLMVQVAFSLAIVASFAICRNPSCLLMMGRLLSISNTAVFLPVFNCQLMHDRQLF
jgi:hypothetical protein